MRELTPLDWEKARGLPLLYTAYTVTKILTSTRGVPKPMEVEFLEDLFILVKDGDHFDAFPTIELAEHRLRILRKNPSDELDVTRIVDALLLLGYLSTLHPEMARSVYFDGIKKDAAQNLSTNIGLHSHLALIAASNREAELHAENAESLFKKALLAIENLNSYSPGIPSNPIAAREHAAIDIGAALCAQLHRLPTKTELITALEERGHSYSSKKKDTPGSWKALLHRVGLDSLPD